MSLDSADSLEINLPRWDLNMKNIEVSLWISDAEVVELLVISKSGDGGGRKFKCSVEFTFLQKYYMGISIVETSDQNNITS